jgi:tRNA uridine 5-carboxymethylaminomethyl modification enzyme
VNADEIYVNGLSMSLPESVQREVVAALPGLASARMVRAGYAVEYDFVQPTELLNTLETRRFRGLFLAGQINGTSGYEEAAGQGLIAGLNAARLARREEPISVGRHQGYLGVMIDDLVTHGCLEPYRLFTSRAEHRLHLRADNADLRLTPLARAAALVDEGRWQRFEERRRRLDENRAVLRRHSVQVPTGARMPAEEALRRPGVDVAALMEYGVPLLGGGPGGHELATLETEVKYEGYLRRQEAEMRRTDHAAALLIPDDFVYRGLPGLSAEIVQRLEERRPESLGQASRIPGVTPAAAVLLHAVLSRRKRESGAHGRPAGARVISSP